MSLRYLHFNNISIDTHNQLLTRKNETINLAPKVYDLLIYFCQNHHRVISKDELMDQVWTGTLVTENAISRTLVKVRKALDDDPKNPIFIITVPKKGYRMVAQFTPSEQTLGKDSSTFSNQNTLTNQPYNPIEAQPSATANARDYKRAYIKVVAAVFVLITITLIATLSFKSSNQIQTKQIKPFTRDVGNELNPSVSPDLSLLAYTKEAIGEKSYIQIEDVETHTKRTIIHPRAKLSKPIWSPNKDKLAFLYQHNNVCMIYWANIEFIEDKETWESITECNANSSPNFVFTPDGTHLYFNNKTTHTSGYQIFRVDVSTKQKDIINQPITNGLGNYAFDISSDGKKLIMLNSEFSPNTRVYTLDIASSKLSQTTQLPYLMRSVNWHHDNNSIIHPSPHPAYELWQSNLLGEKLAVLASNTSRVKHISRINNDEDFAFVSYLLNRDIFFKSNGKETELSNSSVMDYLPTLANKSQQYAFVSKRSTHAEVYLANTTENDASKKTAKQITFFSNPVKLYQLTFSPNDKQLLILADNQVFITDLLNLETTKLPLENMAISGMSWQDENTLLFSTIKNNAWYAMRYDLEKQEISSLPLGYQGGIYSPIDDAYYLIADNSSQVMRFKNFNEPPTSIGLNCMPSFINRKLNLQVTDTGLICQSSTIENTLVHYSFKEKTSKIWQQSPNKVDFDVNSNGIIYTKMTRSVADIMRTISL
jgi:DNA-binding winged helix-turn-helix (wHTH) protein